MKRTRYMAVLLVMAAISACSPLQQAPLVYSSKQSLGVDFSTATTEQPGLALNLGFKSVDAAYVPVAVGKPCEAKATPAAGAEAKSPTSNDAGCSGENYRLMEIRGGRNNTDSSIPKETVENAQKLVTDFTVANAAKKSTDAAVTDARTAIGKLWSSKREAGDKLKKAKAEPSKKEASVQEEKKVTTDPESEKIEIADLQKDVENSKASVDALEKQIAEYEKQIAAANDDLKRKTELAAVAQANFDKIPISNLADALKIVVTASSGRNDAYSVFGSFTANTAFGTTGSVPSSSTTTTGVASSATAGIVLGKVFSTGVASQNLTEGIQHYYANTALAMFRSSYSDCMNAVTASLKRMGYPDVATTDEQKQKSATAYAVCAGDGSPKK